MSRMGTMVGRGEFVVGRVGLGERLRRMFKHPGAAARPSLPCQRLIHLTA